MIRRLLLFALLTALAFALAWFKISRYRPAGATSAVHSTTTTTATAQFEPAPDAN